MEKYVESLLQKDPHEHIVEAFRVVLHVYIPEIIRDYGTIKTMVNQKTYELRIRNVDIPNNGMDIEDCFESSSAYHCIISGDIILVDSSDVNNEIIIQKTKTPLFKLPIPTGLYNNNNNNNNNNSNAMQENNNNNNVEENAIQDKNEEIASGIFILNGKMRTIPPVTSLIYNEIFLMNRKETHVLQVRSAHNSKPFRSTSTIELFMEKKPKRANREGYIGTKLPFQVGTLHVVTLCMALGYFPHELNDMVKKVAGPLYSLRIFRSSEISNVFSKTSMFDVANREKATHTAILTISKLYGKQILSTGENIIAKEVFPHIMYNTSHLCTCSKLPCTCLNEGRNKHDNWRFRKFVYLSKCVCDLVLFHHGSLSETCRDKYTNVIIRTSADLVGQLFRLLYLNHMKMVGKLLRRAIVKVLKDNNNEKISLLEVAKIYGESRISACILSAIASGVWSSQRKGMSQSLNSNNRMSIMSQLRRLSSSLISTDGKHTEPRNVQTDQFGYVCPASTPGGDATGLVYELAAFASIMPPMTDAHNILKLVLNEIHDLVLGIVETSEIRSVFLIDMFGNLGHTLHLSDVQTCCARIFAFRRKTQTRIFVCFQHNVLRLYYEGGLLVRPLLVACEETLRGDIHGTSFNDLLKRGLVEWVCPAEEAHMHKVALTLEEARVHKTCTHIEMSEASPFGLVACTVPFLTSQQGPRLSYFTSQLKQFFCCEINPRRGAIVSTKLWTCHKNLVTTSTCTVINDEGMYVPLVMALLHLPQNQEDALIFKKSTIDRGALLGSTTRTYVSDCLTNSNGKVEHFERRTDALSMKPSKYDKVGENGLVPLGCKVEGGDIIISKNRTIQRPTKDGLYNEVMRRDISTTCSESDGGRVIESRQLNMTSGVRSIVTIETPRIPVVGDKFTTRYSQKGVIGAIWNDEDMPFSNVTGMSPDIITSPLSITSRMTMGTIIECLTGKAVALSGKMEMGIDNHKYTASLVDKCEDMGNMLIEHGFSKSGKEMFIDGRTGERILAHVFTGIVSYARLIHLAEKKAHVRTTGPRDPLTRQPRDGRKFGGGLRTGEMEVAALAAHGASKVLQERVCDFSDMFILFVCGKCFDTADACEEIEYFHCTTCETHEHVLSCKIPFTLLVLMNELEATGISMKLCVTLDEESKMHVALPNPDCDWFHV